MQFAYRMHKAFINLDPGGVMHFALPPTTGGVILIKAEHVTVGGTDHPGDHVTAAVGGGDWWRARGVGDAGSAAGCTTCSCCAPTMAGVSSAARRASRRRRPRENFDPTNPDFDFEIDGGSGGPPGELTLGADAGQPGGAEQDRARTSCTRPRARAPAGACG